MGDFPYAEWLARDYKDRAEVSKNWVDSLKVGVTINGADADSRWKILVTFL